MLVKTEKRQWNVEKLRSNLGQNIELQPWDLSQSQRLIINLERGGLILDGNYHNHLPS